MRPTCEVNGLLSGYTGEGAKTVLPAKAMAKVSCRLVPDQTPAEIEALMKAHVERVKPAGVTVTVTASARRRSVARRARMARCSTPRDARWRRRIDREPVITGEGGSIPVVGDFQRILNAPVLLVGFGLAGRERARAERVDERGELSTGMRAMAALWDELAPR